MTPEEIENEFITLRGQIQDLESHYRGEISSLEKQVDKLQNEVNSLSRKIDYECASDRELNQLKSEVNRIQSDLRHRH